MNKWSNQIQQVNTSQQEGQVFGKYDRELQKIYCKIGFDAEVLRYI